MKNLYLSIIIPAYNEEKNLKKGVLDEVNDYLKGVNYLFEVLIVDDGSTDKTKELIKGWMRGKRGYQLIENPHGGKALTVISGLLAAKGEIALFTDMDQATPLHQLEKLLAKFQEGYDIVIGSRHGRQGAPILRRLAAWGFAQLRNIILGLPFLDTQCGFKAFNIKSRQAIFPKLQQSWQKMRATGAAVHAGFDIETLFLAKKAGFKIAEVQVIWHYVGTERVQLIKDSLDAIRDMVRIRWNDLTGKY
ncbi:glycosyltransferase [Candidatus Microgenomates bacterium]|nr:glycosyltransferase [Candidatus Microgenomates bacterium]